MLGLAPVTLDSPMALGLIVEPGAACREPRVGPVAGPLTALGRLLH